MVYRVRKQLVEEGLEAVLRRKPRAAPAVPGIFDGEEEAKLIALACSEPPKGPDNLMAPVELVSFARRKRQRHVGVCHLACVPAPGPGIAANRVIADPISQGPQPFEEPDQS